MTYRYTRTSKFMSMLLRHRPETGGLTLDAQGYVDVEALLRALAANGHALDRPKLEELVATNPKRRFAFDETGQLIRAVQGHSLDVDLGLEAVVPPDELFHGTVAKFLEAIRADGLKPGARRFVHLSPDRETAREVGLRRGRPVILTIDAAAMHGAGHAFYRAENGVWLTPIVPVAFVRGWNGA